MNNLYEINNKGIGEWLIMAPCEEDALRYVFYILHGAKSMANLKVLGDVTDTWFKAQDDSSDLKAMLDKNEIGELIGGVVGVGDMAWFVSNAYPNGTRLEECNA